MAIPKLIHGFLLHPTGVELIKYVLKRKVMGKKFHSDVIVELDIYKYAPWDLPDIAYMRNEDMEWYFFCPIEKKYGSGGRLNRATEHGFWKAIGKDRVVQHNNHIVGMIKPLVFHFGKAPRGDRTDWVTHEYRIEDMDLADKGIVQGPFVRSISELGPTVSKFRRLKKSFYTSRDILGHVTLTLSIVGSNFVSGANIFGFANGTAKGGSPRSHVAAYKVCWLGTIQIECTDEDIMKSFEDAISDCVDVISCSLGKDGHT